MTATFSRNEAISFGWDKMLANLGLFTLLCLSSFLLAALQQSLRQTPSGYLYSGSWLAGLALQMLHVGVTMAWIKAALSVHDGKHVKAAELLPSLQVFLSYLLAAALYSLLVVCGFILLVVPGVLWAIRYGFFGFLILDQQLDPLTALKRSAQLTEGVRAELFVFGLVVLGINILGAMAFGVGLLATVPTSAVAAAYVYRRLLSRAAAAHSEASHTAGLEPHAAAV